VCVVLSVGHVASRIHHLMCFHYRSGRIHCSICRGVDACDSGFYVCVLRYIKASLVTARAGWYHVVC